MPSYGGRMIIVESFEPDGAPRGPVIAQCRGRDRNVMTTVAASHRATTLTELFVCHAEALAAVRTLLETREIKSSLFDRNSFKIGDVFALL